MKQKQAWGVRSQDERVPVSPGHQGKAAQGPNSGREVTDEDGKMGGWSGVRSGRQEPRRPLVARGVTDPDEDTTTAENSQRLGRPCPWPELPGLGGDAGSPPPPCCQ